MVTLVSLKYSLAGLAMKQGTPLMVRLPMGSFSFGLDNAKQTLLVACVPAAVPPPPGVEYRPLQVGAFLVGASGQLSQAMKDGMARLAAASGPALLTIGLSQVQHLSHLLSLRDADAEYIGAEEDLQDLPLEVSRPHPGPNGPPTQPLYLDSIPEGPSPAPSGALAEEVVRQAVATLHRATSTATNASRKDEEEESSIAAAIDEEHERVMATVRDSKNHSHSQEQEQPLPTSFLNENGVGHGGEFFRTAGGAGTFCDDEHQQPRKHTSGDKAVTTATPPIRNNNGRTTTTTTSAERAQFFRDQGHSSSSESLDGLAPVTPAPSLEGGTALTANGKVCLSVASSPATSNRSIFVANNNSQKKITGSCVGGEGIAGLGNGNGNESTTSTEATTTATTPTPTLGPFLSFQNCPGLESAFIAREANHKSSVVDFCFCSLYLVVLAALLSTVTPPLAQPQAWMALTLAAALPVAAAASAAFCGTHVLYARCRECLLMMLFLVTVLVARRDGPLEPVVDVVALPCKLRSADLLMALVMPVICRVRLCLLLPAQLLSVWSIARTVPWEQLATACGVGCMAGCGVGLGVAGALPLVLVYLRESRLRHAMMATMTSHSASN